MNRKDNAPGKNILLLGTNYFATHILSRLMFNINNKITVMDRKDPHYIFESPDTAKYYGDNRITLLHLSQWDYSHYLEDILREEDSYSCIINCLNIHDAKFSAINPRETIWTNETFTADLMETLRQSDYNGKFIHISSDKVYGPGHTRQSLH